MWCYNTAKQNNYQKLQKYTLEEMTVKNKLHIFMFRNSQNPDLDVHVPGISQRYPCLSRNVERATPKIMCNSQKMNRKIRTKHNLKKIAASIPEKEEACRNKGRNMENFANLFQKTAMPTAMPDCPHQYGPRISTSNGCNECYIIHYGRYGQSKAICNSHKKSFPDS